MRGSRLKQEVHAPYLRCHLISHVSFHNIRVETWLKMDTILAQQLRCHKSNLCQGKILAHTSPTT